MKDNFDDILKNKWEQVHFPVDDRHRQDMIALLDNQKRRRTGLLWWWTGIGAVVTSVAIILFLQVSNQSEEVNPAAQSTTISNEQEAVVSQNSQPANSTIEVKPDNNSEKPSSSPVTSVPSANSTPATSQSSETLISTSASSSVTSNPLSSSPARDPGDPKSESSKQKIKQVKNKVTDKSFADGDKLKKTSDIKVQQEIVVSGNNILETKEITIDSKENLSESYKPLVIVERNNDITSFLPGLEMQYLKYNLNDDIPIETTKIKKRPIRLFAEAGAGLVFASKPDYSSGWTFNVGGGLDLAMNQRTHLGFSGGYLLQNGGFDFERASIVNQLSFGSRSSFNTLSPKKLHFVYAKAGLHHHIHRNVFSVFGGVQYLYGAQGDITIQVVDDFLGTMSHTDQNVWLKLDGMQQYLINAEVQYGYQITPKLSLHSGLRYYFTGIEAKDPELVQRGFYWNGKYSRISPFFTLNYSLYGTR